MGYIKIGLGWVKPSCGKEPHPLMIDPHSITVANYTTPNIIVKLVKLYLKTDTCDIINEELVQTWNGFYFLETVWLLLHQQFGIAFHW